uniref:Conserved plasma membrane protein n=1 Tax=Macrostomum lignano TaxID=282301 RepID=A0A1I8IYX9_9PLAT
TRLPLSRNQEARHQRWRNRSAGMCSDGECLRRVIKVSLLLFSLSLAGMGSGGLALGAGLQFAKKDTLRMAFQYSGVTVRQHQGAYQSRRRHRQLGVDGLHCLLRRWQCRCGNGRPRLHQRLLREDPNAAAAQFYSCTSAVAASKKSATSPGATDGNESDRIWQGKQLVRPPTCCQLVNRRVRTIVLRPKFNQNERLHEFLLEPDCPFVAESAGAVVNYLSKYEVVGLVLAGLLIGMQVLGVVLACYMLKILDEEEDSYDYYEEDW